MCRKEHYQHRELLESNNSKREVMDGMAFPTNREELFEYSQRYAVLEEIEKRKGVRNIRSPLVLTPEVQRILEKYSKLKGGKLKGGKL